MDEIFLRDYANNVATAQYPTGIAAITSQPGFEGYVPSFSVVDQPMVNQNLNLAPTGGIDLPDLKNLAGNVLKEGIKEYALKKAGLEGFKGNVLRGIVNPLGPIGLASFLPEPINPINALANLNYKAQSSLFGRSKTMADYLAAKRQQKAAQTLERQIQSAVADQERVMAQRAISGGQGQSIPDRNRGQVAPSSGLSSKERGAALHG